MHHHIGTTLHHVAHRSQESRARGRGRGAQHRAQHALRRLALACVNTHDYASILERCAAGVQQLLQQRARHSGICCRHKERHPDLSDVYVHSAMASLATKSAGLGRVAGFMDLLGFCCFDVAPAPPAHSAPQALRAQKFLHTT